MKVVIISGVERGLASRCAPVLHASADVQLTGVIDVQGPHPDRLRRWRRKARKLWQIGVGGALNGVRMRAWFDDTEAGSLADVCAALDIPVWQTPYLNADRTIDLIKASGADLGLSLGNGFIAPRVFGAPRWGMINVHCELLPAYQNASSIIWPIYHGETQTGLTIHCIERRIDAGSILHQQVLPIRFGPTLEASVRNTIGITYSQVPAALLEVCVSFEEKLAAARPQRDGTSFTTPSWRQFRRMRQQNQRLYQEQLARQMIDADVDVDVDADADADVHVDADAERTRQAAAMTRASLLATEGKP